MESKKPRPRKKASRRRWFPSREALVSACIVASIAAVPSKVTEALLTVGGTVLQQAWNNIAVPRSAYDNYIYSGDIVWGYSFDESQGSRNEPDWARQFTRKEVSDGYFGNGKPKEVYDGYFGGGTIAQIPPRYEDFSYGDTPDYSFDGWHEPSSKEKRSATSESKLAHGWDTYGYSDGWYDSDVRKNSPQKKSHQRHGNVGLASSGYDFTDSYVEYVSQT